MRQSLSFTLYPVDGDRALTESGPSFFHSWILLSPPLQMPSTPEICISLQLCYFFQAAFATFVVVLINKSKQKRHKDQL